jgi:hypothetical protein
MIRPSLRLRALLVVAAVSAGAPGCGPHLRAAQSMAVVRQPKTPRDASVTIDEEYIGPLGYVAAHGVRLPLGEHRITVEHEGYFPYDTVIVAGRDPIRLEVALVPIPD